VLSLDRGNNALLLDPHDATIARDILSRLSTRFVIVDPAGFDEPSLAGGCAGLALSHAMMHQVFPDRGHDALAATALDRAVDILSAGPSRPSFFNGFSGVAWVTELLYGHLAVNAEDDPNVEVDSALATLLERAVPDQSFDLLDGVTGIGVYALERLPRSNAERILELVIDRLAETAERCPTGLAWRSRREWIQERFRPAQLPEWNLGMAHGLPAVIAFLGRVASAPLSSLTRERARDLAEGATQWLLANDAPEGFAYYLGNGVTPEPARLAWCYGDPGVAAALIVAGGACGERRWEDEGIRIGLRAAKRLPAEAGVKDAGLCHGAAGLAHIFHRFYLTTGREEFFRAARLWFAQVFAMRGESGEFGGYQSYGPDREGRLGWHDDSGFLTGAGGIVLALAAAIRNTDAVWDRALMLSA